MKKVLVDCYRFRRGKNQDVLKTRRTNPRLCDLIEYEEEWEDPETGETHIETVTDWEDTNRPATGMRMRNTYDRKEFGEHLAPLSGLVRSFIDRPWDDCYSEICEILDMRSPTQAHIFQHLYDEIWVCGKTNSYNGDHLVFVGNKPHRRSVRNGKERIYPLYHGFVAFVDPRDGLVKRNPFHGKKRSTRPPSRPQSIWIDNRFFFQRDDNLWFEIVEDPRGTRHLSPWEDWGIEIRPLNRAAGVWESRNPGKAGMAKSCNRKTIQIIEREINVKTKNPR